MDNGKQIKCCTKCGVCKIINEFRKLKKGKYGVHSVCKICMSEKERQNRKDGCTKHREINRRHYEKNRDKFLKKFKQNRRNNIDIIKLKEKKWRENNKEKIIAYGKKWRENNKEKIKIDKRNYYEKNRDKVNKNKNEYRKKYYKKNPHIGIWRYTLKNVLKRLGQTKNNSTHKILGYSPEDLKTNLESKFTDGMSWDNYGEWHVDHIKPVSSFNKDTPPKIVNSLDNLQPLWATTREINGVIYEGNLNKYNKK